MLHIFGEFCIIQDVDSICDFMTSNAEIRNTIADTLITQCMTLTPNDLMS